MADNKENTLTTANGSPVADNQNSLTAGPRGPLLVQDGQLFERHAHLHSSREPLPPHEAGWKSTAHREHRERNAVRAAPYPGA